MSVVGEEDSVCSGEEDSVRSGEEVSSVCSGGGGQCP